MEFLFLAFERPDVDRNMNLPSCLSTPRGCTSNYGVLVTERAKPLSPVPSRTFIKHTRYVLLNSATQTFVPHCDSKGKTCLGGKSV